MDTIIFFRKRRGIQEPLTEAIGMRSHLLLRVTLDVGEEEWFGIKLVQEAQQSVPAAQKEQEVQCGKESDIRPDRRFRPLQAICRLCRGIMGRESSDEDFCGAGSERDSGQNGFKERQALVGQNDSGQNGINKEPQAFAEQNDSGQIFIGRQEEQDPAAVGRHRRRKSQTKKERREAERAERQRLWEEGQEQLQKVESAIQKLIGEIQELIGTTENCFCVYEDNVKKALAGKALERKRDDAESETGEFQEQKRRPEDGKEILPALWEQYFSVEEFHDYFGQLWVEELLPKAILPHFVILGSAPCLPALIEKNAHRMKSLRWILPEAECSQELMDFVEDFYTEYGLAIALQPAPPEQKKLKASFEEPCNVLDFTRETQIAVWEIAKGSIWLDMLSMEEKRRRIVARSTGILYYSLKEKWKQAQKKAPYVPPRFARAESVMENKFPK